MTTNFNTQSGVVSIKEVGTLDPYKWAGERVQLAEIVSSYGDVTPTTAFDARGGIKTDGVLVGEPAAVTSTLTLKAQQFDRMRTELLGKRHNIDRRMHNGGKDRDSTVSWIDIERMIGAHVTGRTTPKTASTAQEEALVTMPVSGERTVDIYRVTYAPISLSSLAAGITHAHVGDPISQYNSKATVYAVTDPNATHSNVIILYNDNNGRSAD